MKKNMQTRHRPPTWALVLLLGAMLSACVSVEVGTEGSAQIQYRLDDTRGAGTRRASPLPHTIVVTSVVTGSAGEAFAMMFSRAPQQRAAYQNASWTDRPSARVAQLVVDRMAASGSFQSVALLGRGIAGDLLLNISVTDIYHDASSQPGNGRLELSAELIDRATRRLVARKSFSASVPLEGAEGSRAAAAALSRASGQVIDQLTAWVESAAEGLPSPRR